MHLKYIHTCFFILILSSSFAAVQNNKIVADIILLTTKTEFEAGNTIVLKFSSSEIVKPLLYCSNSYGSTLVSPYNESEVLEYKIPINFSNKTGTVYWKVLHDNASLNGHFNISSKQEVATMETYIGPPSIEAGGTDYTMLVVIPTDSLDNPLADNTSVTAKHQFLATEKSEDIFTKNLISYKNIYSKKESGRMLVSSESLNTNSKEFSITVFPAIPINFTISANRPHDYGDGNQITTFTTSIIKDKQGNIVSDGTYVSFFITNENGNILKTSGSTINGMATSKIIHPDYDAQWRIKAYVDGMAESNTITLAYNQVVQNFNVVFTKNNRGITVGPIQSFMQQMIPDGLKVKLLVYKSNSLIGTDTKTSYEGLVHFNLKPDIFINGDYTIVIKTAGLEQIFNSKKLW